MFTSPLHYLKCENNVILSIKQKDIFVCQKCEKGMSSKTQCLTLCVMKPAT